MSFDLKRLLRTAEHILLLRRSREKGIIDVTSPQEASFEKNAIDIEKADTQQKRD